VLGLRNWDDVLYQLSGSTLRTILEPPSADTSPVNAAVVSDGSPNGAVTTPLLIDPTTANVSGQGNFPTLTLTSNAGAVARTFAPGDVNTGANTIHYVGHASRTTRVRS